MIAPRVPSDPLATAVARPVARNETTTAALATGRAARHVRVARGPGVAPEHATAACAIAMAAPAVVMAVPVAGPQVVMVAPVIVMVAPVIVMAALAVVAVARVDAPAVGIGARAVTCHPNGR